MASLNSPALTADIGYCMECGSLTDEPVPTTASNLECPECGARAVVGTCEFITRMAMKIAYASNTLH